MRVRIHRGQTLLELLTALFVLGLVLVGALALTSSNFRLESIGSSRLVATNLAREGIELARGIRDSNWLKGQAFNAGLSNAKHCSVIARDDARFFVDHFSFQDCADVFDSSFQLFQTADGRYESDPASGTGVERYRLIRLDPICLNGNVETVQTESSCEAGSDIGVAVNSQVGWYQAGQKMTVSLTEHIYDWE